MSISIFLATIMHVQAECVCFWGTEQLHFI